MKSISNADYLSVLRLLDALSRRKGKNTRESEEGRKAGLLVKKLRRNKT